MANGGGHVNRKNSKLLKLIGIHILAVAVSQFSNWLSDRVS